MNYRISKEAANDLENIWTYTFYTWPKPQADRYFNLIMNETEFLTENPNSGKNYSTICKGYYRSQVKSHFIFSRVNLKNAEIEIIRILHQQMDITSRLND
jgi:toxin ParE1/3/4